MATQIGDTYNQPTAAPSLKVQAVGVSGAAALVLSYIIQVSLGVELPPLVAESFILVVAFLGGYFKRERI